MPITRESLVHAYWKWFYAGLYREHGYEVELESPRQNGKGRVDVVATRASESVGIEIETGKSDVVWNVKQDLSSRIDKVLVVATDEAALKKVERQLATAGILIAGRVKLALRDHYEKAA